MGERLPTRTGAGRVRVGIDVGGTFTDVIALDETTGALMRLKVASTPRAPELGVAEALRSLLCEVAPQDIVLLSHSSTVATNALLGQLNLELPTIALLATQGFRDVLEIGRQNRSELYNLSVRRPVPLVERRLRFGVCERLDPFGRVVTALERASLEPILNELARAGVGAVAIAFLHSYANPEHERLARAALLERFPELPVIVSSEVDPEYREFERTSTTVVNAVLGPLVRGYLERLEAHVRRLGIGAPAYVMQSGGGMAALGTVADRPASLIESGPASGVIAAAYLGAELGLENVLSFDMGGTTAKAGTIVAGRVQVARELEAAGRTHSGRAVKGSGYPVRFPFVDLAEVSAGGGTIAFVDAGGALRVGPLSAGADPGPAAYGRAMQPTVTDADIVLGRLNPFALLGGALKIDASRSRQALEALLPSLPELDLDGLAAGVVRLVDAEMAKILRIVTVERGHDPRSFSLIAFGGAGPLHACAVAWDLGIARIVIPVDPGLFSAYGLLAADLRVNAVRSVMESAERLDPARAESLFAEMERAGVEVRIVANDEKLAAQGNRNGEAALTRELDVRYLGQGFELAVPASTPFDGVALQRALEDFHVQHHQAYGYASPEDAIEIVAARSTAVGLRAKPKLAVTGAAASRSPAPAAVDERREVYFAGEGRRATPVFARAALKPGNRLAGPALIEQYDSCTLVAPGWDAIVDRFGNLLLTKDGVRAGD